MSPSDRKYNREHEWVKLDDANTGQAVSGITDYAQDQLGDIVYFDLPPAGTSVKQLEKMGEVESVKAVSDLYSAVTGTIIEVNPELAAHPELTNQDPFGAGWLVRVEVTDVAQLEALKSDIAGLENLMSADEYASYISGLS